ncbi:MAG TPA: response regulator transcription factor [Gemmatimonadales bacterium]|jgi:DNA-binding CsgD family transcriptional regulator|nr:response regulator transcription factor [Gemmatimonadales bacterium]
MPNDRMSGRPGPTLRSQILLYGLLGGGLIALLRLIEYRWLVLDHSIEIYGGLIAALFAGLGVWLGLRLTRPRETVVVREVVVEGGAAFVRNDAEVEAMGLTPRELEMLELVAVGLSNREIAARAFVSENTVKTHLSRVFDKLGASRRTQAVQRARQLRLIA